MSTEKQTGGPGPWIIFPEIIGVFLLALLLPLPLIHLVVSGYALKGIAGLGLWLLAVLLGARFIRRRRYGLAYLPMLMLIGVFLIIQKFWH